MAAKTLLFLGAGICFVSLGAYAKDRKERIEQVINQLKFSLLGVKNIQLSFKQISMQVTIRASNPTSEDLSINTGFIKAKVIRVYEKKTGKLLAFSNLDTSKINLPSGGYFDLPPVQVDIPSLTGAQYLLNELSGKDQQNILQNFSFELDLTALGTTKTIHF